MAIRTWTLALATGAALAATAGADEPTTRTFVGSFRVPAERRADVLKQLKEKGHAGAFVPDGAAPETILFRGTRAAYEAAEDTVNRLLRPDSPPARAQGAGGLPAGRPRGGRIQPGPTAGKSDKTIFDQLKLTKQQAADLAALQQRVADMTAAMKKLESGHIEEGMRINAEWRAGLARILTEDQLKAYMRYWTGQ